MDELTGDERIVRGPQAYAPEPLETIVPWQRLRAPCRRVAHHIQRYIYIYTRTRTHLYIYIYYHIILDQASFKLFDHVSCLKSETALGVAATCCDVQLQCAGAARLLASVRAV